MGCLGGVGGGKRRKTAKTRERSVPLDVISDILSRLPTRSAVRFGCVSRPWRDLVTKDRYFQQEQYRRSLTGPPHLAALSREEDGCITFNLSRGTFLPPVDIAFGHIHTSRPLAFRNACDGILCFVAPLDGSVLLCNPITGQILALPEFSTCTASSIRFRHSAALGFSPSTHEYKVARLSYDEDDDDDDSRVVIAEVYSLDSPNPHWRRLRCGDAPYPPDRKIVYCQGKLHWIHQNRVVTFDVAREEFTAMVHRSPGFGTNTVLMELNGRLYLVLHSLPTQQIEVSVLRDSCWHKVCLLSGGKVLPGELNTKLPRVLNMWERRGGNLLLLRLQDKWISYDLGTKTQNNPKLIVGPVTPADDWEICHGYRASLVSLKADGNGNYSSGWARFYKDLGLAGWATLKLRSSVGYLLETLDMVARMHPRHEPNWCWYQATQIYFHNYLTIAKNHNDRHTLGPHYYRNHKQARQLPSNVDVEVATTHGLDLFEYKKLWWW